MLLGGTSGAIFALSGISGEDLRNFPFYTQVTLLSRRELRSSFPPPLETVLYGDYIHQVLLYSVLLAP